MAKNHPNGHFPVNLLILKNNNYENWCKQIKVVFYYQDPWDLVNGGVTTLAEAATDQEKVAHK